MNAQVHATISQQTSIHPDTRSVTAFGANATLIKTRATEFIEQRLNYFENNVADFLFELAEKIGEAGAAPRRLRCGLAETQDSP